MDRLTIPARVWSNGAVVVDLRALGRMDADGEWERIGVLGTGEHPIVGVMPGGLGIHG